MRIMLVHFFTNNPLAGDDESGTKSDWWASSASFSMYFVRAHQLWRLVPKLIECFCEAGVVKVIEYRFVSSYAIVSVFSATFEVFAYRSSCCRLDS